ncbi:UV radiation resistance associated protein [Chlorella vulgaris]
MSHSQAPWHASKRLRQLECISGRGLVLGCASKVSAPAAHYVTLSARCVDGGEGSSTPAFDATWRLLYRSEAVTGTLNPEWQPLAWCERQLLLHDPLLDSSEVQLLLGLHALEQQSEQHQQEHLLAAASAESALSFEHDGAPLAQHCTATAAAEYEADDSMERPTLFAAASRPAVNLSGAHAQDTSAPEAGPGAARIAAMPLSSPNGAAGQLPSTRADDNAPRLRNGHLSPADMQQQQPPPPQQPQPQRGEAPGQPPGQADQQGPQQADQQGQQEADQQGHQQQQQEAAAEPVAAQPQMEACGECQADSSGAEQPGSEGTDHPQVASGASTAAAAVARERWPAPAGAALASTGHCPGRLVAAWHLASLDLLFPAGSELAALQQPLQPNTLVLQFGGASFLCPPPMQQRPAGLGSQQTSLAGTAAAAGTAKGTPAGGSSTVGAKTLTLAGTYQYITSLAALQGRLRDLVGRSQALQQQLAEALGPEAVRQRQQQQLRDSALEGERCRQRAAEVRGEVAEVQAEATGARKQATVRAQALVTTLKVMQASSRRMGEAQAALRGEAGRGALVAVLRELVARRCLMVCQLGSILQLGPTSVSILEAPPGGYLEDRLEQQWAGAAPSSSPGSSSSMGFGSPARPWQDRPCIMHSASGNAYRQEMRLSIGGLEIQPGVWRGALDGGAYESDPSDARAAGVALGYVAQMVDRLAAYLDVPLRYPLVLRGSRSLVVDAYPPTGTWAGEGDASAVRRPLFGRAEAAAALGELAHEYPLYCETNRERPRFAVGVFLLNKDVIQLLQTHGISAAGPNQLLQNLYKLLLAAETPDTQPAQQRARQACMEGQHLPYTNTRLVLQEELDDDSYFLSSTVVRLFASQNSHPAVRGTLQGLRSMRVSLGALAVQALVNKRGPDGVVGVIPGEQKHSARLMALCQQCHDNGEVLACSLPSADMVLVPRLPSTAAQDGLYFLAYATNLRAVELCERLRQQKQVALVLDLDNTLVDAVSCTIAPSDWDLLDWRYVLVTNSYNRQIQAQYAPLPGHDAFSEDVWVMHWKVGRINCTFKVRVRRGWADLRQYLAQNADRFAVFVCSKGKREYIQLLWLMLDPLGQLIPQSDWDTRLTSTFPDTLAQAANKTALTALGCYDITKPHVATQLAAPIMCLDDSTEAYEPEYGHNLMYVEEYRPSDLLQADNGNVLRQAGARLDAFWAATCASDGTFAWQAAQSFAMALMKTMQRNPMGSPDDLSYLQVRCAKQGEALWHQFTVLEVFGEQGVFIPDAPERDVPLHGHPTADGELCRSCQLPQCKPGCPVSAAEASTPQAAAASPGRLAGTVTVAEDAFSEGRSSEDSVLLGLPSPKDSVLPPYLPPAVPLHSLPPSAAASTGEELQAKLRRIGGWDPTPVSKQQGATQPAAVQGILAPPASGEGALSAALRSTGQGPTGPENDAHCTQPPAVRQLPPTAPRRHSADQAVSSGGQAAAPAQPAKSCGGAGSSVLAAALAAISRGLVEDGLT